MSEPSTLSSFLLLTTAEVYLRATVGQGGAISFEVQQSDGEWVPLTSGQTISFSNVYFCVRTFLTISWSGAVAPKLAVTASGTTPQKVSQTKSSTVYSIGPHVFDDGAASYKLTVSVDSKASTLTMSIRSGTASDEEEHPEPDDIVIEEDPPNTGINPTGLDWLTSVLERIEREMGVLVANALGPRKDPGSEQLRLFMDLRASGVRTLKSRLSGYVTMGQDSPSLEAAGDLDEGPGRGRAHGRVGGRTPRRPGRGGGR